ncbi:FHA domain-containing protein [Ruegeria halocynthiae]|uniref:FHA domain-containing protein n=1 Tax=Ruegeria halocynthiae TaxID=985054 RepID=A0A1H2Y8V0_9RHOB|nr:FHA domain-containing protein [Ruegeria halocynthiae]SDX01567.1 FHA domain-containing protein [Ruegeria halocynthiae]
MFKYKSPLSRLLEGAGKPKEEDAAEIEAVEEAVETEKPEPIADFNALRAALAGGNVNSDSYEETDELIPEEPMPEFDEDQTVEEEVAEAPEVEGDDEQIVTLHLNTEDVAEEEQPLAEVAELAGSESEDVAEAPDQPEFAAEPASEPVPMPVDEAPQSAEAPAPAEDRRSRVKTTFLGFERADTHVQELIETAEPVAKTDSTQETFPVGWLVITAGPGRGACVTLTEGLMQIGRNDDQAIQLDFGDTGISRSNHAVIAYDPEDRKCYLGHGGKANLVRLNGKPVLSTIALSSGDLVRISETSVRFTAFCDDGFDWRDAD